MTKDFSLVKIPDDFLSKISNLKVQDDVLY